MGGGGSGAGGAGGPRAQASASIYFTTYTNAMAAMVCPASPHWVNVPFAVAGGQQATGMNKGKTAVDGVDQMSISCKVKGAGDTFDVSASLRSPAFDPNGTPINPTLLTLSASVSTTTDAMGSLTVQDNRTTTSYVSVNDTGLPDGTCTFSVRPRSMLEQLGVAPGRVWASVTCPRLRDVGSADPNEICSIASGIVVLENCEQ
jgi:hypothetical protein